tara:strand:- start:70581 stop:71744 length:1164 start_codon:yes stop_codon:yes gene_type:complete
MGNNIHSFNEFSTNEGFLTKFNKWMSQTNLSPEQERLKFIKDCNEIKLTILDIENVNRHIERVNKLRNKSRYVYSLSTWEKEIIEFGKKYKHYKFIIKDKDDDDKYKFDLAKFYKDPFPLILTDGQMKTMLNFFIEDYKERAEKYLKSLDKFALEMPNHTLTIDNMETPYLKNPDIDLDRIFKKINEDMSWDGGGSSPYDNDDDYNDYSKHLDNNLRKALTKAFTNNTTRKYYRNVKNFFNPIKVPTAEMERWKSQHINLKMNIKQIGVNQFSNMVISVVSINQLRTKVTQISDKNGEMNDEDRKDIKKFNVIYSKLPYISYDPVSGMYKINLLKLFKSCSYKQISIFMNRFKQEKKYMDSDAYPFTEVPKYLSEEDNTKIMKKINK